MGKDQNGSLREIEEKPEEDEEHRRKSKRKSKEFDSESESESEVSSRSDSEEEDRKHSRRKKHHSKKKRSSKKKHRKRYSDEEDSASESGSESDLDSESSSEESEEEERRRRRKKRRREEKDKRSRRREKDKKRREKEKSEDRKRRKKKDRKKSRDKKGAVTDSWGKYGILRETDMWNKRPEFTAWLAEVKQVNLESLANWEEKQMFKDFMEDHNTATFPSKKYYNLDAYHRHQIEKEIKKGSKRVYETERTVFNDEEQRRLELLRVREKQKEEEVEVLKKSMQSGMAQAMKEQAQLREEMAYQYKLGNFEAAAAIQRRLDPDVAM